VNVLLVEDDDAIAEPLVKGLERQGYSVHREATGIGGVDAFLDTYGLDPGDLPGGDGQSANTIDLVPGTSLDSRGACGTDSTRPTSSRSSSGRSPTSGRRSPTRFACHEKAVHGVAHLGTFGSDGCHMTWS
jgi:hypothetical protein